MLAEMHRNAIEVLKTYKLIISLLNNWIENSNCLLPAAYCLLFH